MYTQNHPLANFYAQVEQMFHSLFKVSSIWRIAKVYEEIIRKGSSFKCTFARSHHNMGGEGKKWFTKNKTLDHKLKKKVLTQAVW